MRIYFYVVLLTCLLVNRSFGQARQYTQFGKVNLTEFDIQSTTSDTSTPAIVLSDVGVSEFEGNGNGNFTLVFKHHKRILIKNRLGFDAATIFIALYNGENSSSTEKLEDFEAYTYTRENGRISETKGKKDAVIQEKVNRERVLRKFTFPNIKEGCIIEFRYKVKSPFYNRLRSWNFQSEYPTLWSEYKVVIPPLFDYISSTYGYLDYTVNELSYVPKTYTIRDPISKMQDNNVFTVSGEALVNVWAVKDAPPFLAEPFVYSNLNHIKRIQFQLKSINYSATSTTKVIKDWSETAKDLLKDPDFGAQLEEDNNWMNEIVGKMNKQGELEASRGIYEFIRDRFVCTDFDSKWLSQSLKKTFETKTGTAADLNMLLVAMLRKAGLQSTPFIVSTRENGFVNQNYALPAQFNYTLCRVRINGQYYILDGAHKKLGFGDIPVYCYNGMGRIIDNTALPVVLSPDLLQENKYTNIKIANDDRSMRATIEIVYGKIESFQLRNKITSGKEEEIVRQILTNTPSDFKLLSFSFDSLDQFEKPLQLHIEMNYTTDPDASVLYFNPILLNEWTKNPFISTQRNYSVELPYKFKEEYQIEIAIPKGYKIEEVPSSSKLNMNGNDIRYEYTTRKDSQSVAISNLINASRIIFQKTEYNALRTFFMNIVKKNGEQLVFKKSE